MRKRGFIYRVFDLYYDGFRSMTLGKTLWLVILIKLFIKEHSKGGDDAKFVEKEMLKRN